MHHPMNNVTNQPVPKTPPKVGIGNGNKLELVADGLSTTPRNPASNTNNSNLHDLKMSPIPNKASLVRTSSARQSQNLSSASTSGYSSMMNSVHHPSNGKASATGKHNQTTVNSIFNAGLIDSVTDNNTKFNAGLSPNAHTHPPAGAANLNQGGNSPFSPFNDLDSDVGASFNAGERESRRQALASRESGMSMFSNTTSTLTFEDLFNHDNSNNNNSPNKQFYTHPNNSIMTISPIKNINNSPSLSKNMQKKLNENSATSNKPPIPTSLLSFSRHTTRKKHASAGPTVDRSGIRSTPSLNDVFQNPQNQQHHTSKSVSPSNSALATSLMTSPSRQAPPIPTQSNDIYLQNDPDSLENTRKRSEINNIFGMEDPSSLEDLNNSPSHDIDSISVSKSLRVRATNERKARSAGYGRTPSNHRSEPDSTASYLAQDASNSRRSNAMTKSMSGTLKKSRTRSGNNLMSDSAHQSMGNLIQIPKYNPEIVWEPLPDAEETLKISLAHLSNSLETRKEVETAMTLGLQSATLRPTNDENNWIITANALQNISRLARFHTNAIIPFLSNKINPLVVTFVNSIRSSLSKHALEATEELCTHCARHFNDNQFDILMKSLFGVIS